MNKLLEVKKLSISFSNYLGNVKAVKEIDFSIFSNEIVALVGESGSGKSITAQAILQLIPSPPAKIEGEIFFEGIDLLKTSKKDMRSLLGKKIGMIFQDPTTSLNPTMRIGKQITEGMIKHEGLNKKEAQKRTLQLLEWVGIPQGEKRFFQYPHQLSGGMKQRVMIAIALSCQPKLLIADEPTTSLDVTIQIQILDLLKEIQSQTKTSILLITHDLSLVARICDRIFVMYGGKILEVGSTQQIFSSPFHPYTRGLFQSIPRLDWEKERVLTPISGSPPNPYFIQKGCPFYSRCSQSMPICAYKEPPLIPISPSQSSACWLIPDHQGELSS